MEFPQLANGRNNNLPPPFPQGAAWLLERLQSYSDHISEIELIHCFSWVSLTAILCDEIEILQRRLHTLLNMDKEKLNEDFHLAKRKMIQLIIQTRSQIQQELATEFNIPMGSNIKAFESALTYSQKKHFYKLVHQAIDSKKNHIDYEESQKVVDVLGLLETLQLYQLAHNHLNTTRKEKIIRPPTFQTPFTVPSSLHKQGGLVEANVITSRYSREELAIFFRSLHTTLHKILNFNKPFGLTVSNASHIISIGIINREWIMIDFKDLDFTPAKNDQALADKVFSSLAAPHQTSTLITTKIYAAKNNLHLVEQCLQKWTASPEFILIHK